MEQTGQVELPLGHPADDPFGLSNRPAEVTVFGPQLLEVLDWLNSHGGLCRILHFEKKLGNSAWRVTIEWKR